jgi:hypothetical protein
MAELSAYSTLASRTVLLRAEFRAAFSRALGVPIPPGQPPTVIGSGVGHAFGRPRRLALPHEANAGVTFDGRVYLAIDDLEAWIGGGWHFSRRETIANPREALLEAFNEAAEFMILRGPDPSDLDGLRTYGYKPEEAAATMQRIADREHQLADYLRAEPSNMKRVDDFVTATTITFDLLDSILPSVTSELGQDGRAFVGLGKDGMSTVLADTPILDVEMALRRGNIKNGSYELEVNDIYDLAALGVAVVYCDLVSTDRSAASRLRAAKADKRHACRVVSTPDELIGALVDLASSPK